MIHTSNITYTDQDVTLEGYLAQPTVSGKRPLIILCHAWRGRDEYICHKAEALAKLGYISFAIDIYGKGVLGNSPEQCIALKQPFLENRALLKQRLAKGLEVARSLEHIDHSRIAVLGYGFGGLCALDFARHWQEIKGAISVYGHFEAPGFSTNFIQAKILILHGANDPIVPIQELLAFGKELDTAGTPWQAHIFGNSMHAFASPSANDPEHGVLYNSVAADDCWKEIQLFLQELFI